MTCIIGHFSDWGRSCAAIVWVKIPNFALYGKARGADIRVGRVIRTHKGEQTIGPRACSPGKISSNLSLLKWLLMHLKLPIVI